MAKEGRTKPSTAIFLAQYPPSSFLSPCVSVGILPPYSSWDFKVFFELIEEINTFHYWKLSFWWQNYAESGNTSKFWVSCFSVFYMAGGFFSSFFFPMGFGAAFKLQVSSCSISLTCLNCGLIESKIVFRKCSSGHVCTGSQSTNGTPRRHCAGHSPSCLEALGKELHRCTLRLFPVHLCSCALSWMADLNMSGL